VVPAEIDVPVRCVSLLKLEAAAEMIFRVSDSEEME